MRHLLSCVLLLLLGAGLLCAPISISVAAAATHARKAPPLKEMGGQKVETEYFTVTIPQGWSMPRPVMNNPQGVTALFAIMKGDLAVTISVMKSNLTAKEIGEGTLATMKKGGIESGPLEEKDGIFHSALSGKARGNIWFGAKDGVASVINIVGLDEKRANVLLEAIDSKIAGIFPKSVN